MANHMDVINMSLGANEGYADDPGCGCCVERFGRRDYRLFGRGQRRRHLLHPQQSCIRRRHVERRSEL